MDLAAMYMPMVRNMWAIGKMIIKVVQAEKNCKMDPYSLDFL